MKRVDERLSGRSDGRHRGPQPTNARVDVIVLTKNSERTLKKCLDSVYRNVPVKKLIVIDGCSTDATLAILRQFHEKYGNVSVTVDKGTRGSARQRALSMVESDWFMFVDSDVILSADWFAKAEKLIEDPVGAVWGIEIWSVLRKMKILKLFERVTLKIFEERGGTHDLLVRTKAIEGIRIPPSLHTYEDSYFKSWILSKGYKVVAVYEPYCIHYRPEEVWTIKKSINLVASDLRHAVRHPTLFLSYAVYTAIVVYQSFQRNSTLS